MSSNLTFYYTPISPPCCAINLLISYLDLKVDKKFVNIAVGEHYKPDFVKINPYKTVPFLVDNDLSLSQSRAQLAYLVNKYAPESNLFPSDPVKRARVENFLYFDATSLYSSFGAISGAIIKGGLKEIDPEMIKRTDSYLELLDNELKKSKYVAGDHITIADISLITSYKSISITGFWTDLSKYQHIQAWEENLKKELKNWQENLEIPNKQYGEFIKMKLAANKAA